MASPNSDKVAGGECDQGLKLAVYVRGRTNIVCAHVCECTRVALYVDGWKRGSGRGSLGLTVWGGGADGVNALILHPVLIELLLFIWYYGVNTYTPS